MFTLLIFLAVMYCVTIFVSLQSAFVLVTRNRPEYLWRKLFKMTLYTLERELGIVRIAKKA